METSGGFIPLGSLVTLDLGDYDPEEQRLELRHRPETGTSLKNGSEGERLVALDPYICDGLDDWVDRRRPTVRDDHGRDLMLTTQHGRLSGTTVRKTVYKATRPCYYGDHCPRDRDPDECEGVDYGSNSLCPSSVSPHSVSRGSITHHLSEDVPEKVVSDRMNVGQKFLDKYSDKRSEEVKVEQRREYLEGV